MSDTVLPGGDDYFASPPSVPAPTVGATAATTTGYRPVIGQQSFADRIRAGLRLLPTCWKVLSGDPVLLLVPVVVLALGVAVVLGYAQAFGGFARLGDGGRVAVTVKSFPLLVMLTVISVVGQAVVVSAATERLQGQAGRLGPAWVTTLGQLPRLVFFGFVFAAERTVTGFLRNQRGLGGRFAAGAIDTAWDFATYLAIPVILFEDKPVFASVKRSASLVVKTFGTQLTARAVLSIALFVVSLPLLVVALFLTFTAPALGALLLVVLVIAVIVVSSALTGVLSAALYRYAVTGQVSAGFDESEMWSVFSRR